MDNIFDNLIVKTETIFFFRLKNDVYHEELSVEIILREMYDTTIKTLIIMID